MKTITSINKIRQELKTARQDGKTIGFVPTMGALHNGHLSLIKKCRKENEIVVLSIFVNPTQFGPNEDLSSYPRPKKTDLLLAKKEMVDIIFYPTEKVLYPSSYLTFVNVDKITDTLCGAGRPGHFRGVTTIVSKLFNIVQPDVAYFGQKDIQQCVVIKQMTEDLNFPIRIKILPTVREKDGLALSSRNKYLTSRQRTEAPMLYKALKDAKNKVASGTKNASVIRRGIISSITKATSGKIDYVQCVSGETLRPLKTLEGECIIAVAVKFGKARLIDNISLQIK